MNIEGDDCNVFPYTHYDERLNMDVSRLDQWEIVFAHGTKMGMFLHFKTLETENEMILDNGDLGSERKLYYSELIARFAHHPALTGTWVRRSIQPTPNRRRLGHVTSGTTIPIIIIL